MVMPIMACLTKTFLVAVGVFTNMGGSPQSTLGITFLSLELLTVYLIIGECHSCHFMQWYEADVNQLNTFFHHCVWTAHSWNLFKAPNAYFAFVLGLLAAPHCLITTANTMVLIHMEYMAKPSFLSFILVTISSCVHKLFLRLSKYWQIEYSWLACVNPVQSVSA